MSDDDDKQKHDPFEIYKSNNSKQDSLKSDKVQDIRNLGKKDRELHLNLDEFQSDIKKDKENSNYMLSYDERDKITIHTMEEPTEEDVTEEVSATKTIRNRVILCFIVLLSICFFEHMDTITDFKQLYFSSVHDIPSLFVLPIFLFLFMFQRKKIEYKLLQTSYLGIFLILIFSIGWGYFKIMEYTFFQQLFVGLIVLAITLTIFGIQGFKTLLYPMIFLLFAIPIGQEFIKTIPYILEVTLVETWSFLFNKELNIANEIIYGNGEKIFIKDILGIFLHSPVIVMFGFIYAFFMCNQTLKRLVIALSFFVFPFILIFLFLGILLSFTGWYEFVYVETLSFFISTLTIIGLICAVILGFVLKTPLDFEKEAMPTFNFVSNYTNFTWVIPISIAGLILLSSSQILTMSKDIIYQYKKTLTDLEPPKIIGWEGPRGVRTDNWDPQFPLAKSTFTVQYRKGSQNVQLFTAYFGRDIEAEQVTSPKNSIYNEDKWKIKSQESFRFTLNNYSKFEISELVITRNGYSKLIWFWYYVGNKSETSVTTTNVLDMVRYITKAYDNAGVVALSTNIVENKALARNTLKRFLFTLSPYLNDITDPRVIK